jgi:hypothetical protein
VEDKINDHHIFPSNVDGLDPEKSQTFSELSDSILNRTLLLDETNKHGISNKKPSKYLLEMIEREIVEDGSELQELMADHFISPAAIERMLEDDFDGFIEEREKTITKHIASLLDAEVSKETIV